MIIVSAKLYTGGGSDPTELLHATIVNRGPASDWKDRPGDRYFAHVLARPSDKIPVCGFEADIAVDGHVRKYGITPLLSGILAECFRLRPEDRATYRNVGGVTLQSLPEFERIRLAAAAAGVYKEE